MPSLQEFTNLIAAITPADMGEERVHALFMEALTLDAGEGAESDKFSPEAFSLLCSKHGITPTTSRNVVRNNSMRSTRSRRSRPNTGRRG